MCSFCSITLVLRKEILGDTAFHTPSFSVTQHFHAMDASAMRISFSSLDDGFLGDIFFGRHEASVKKDATFLDRMPVSSKTSSLSFLSAYEIPCRSITSRTYKRNMICINTPRLVSSLMRQTIPRVSVPRFL